MYLSPNFRLVEFERSLAAGVLGFENRTSPQVQANLRRLCNELLQPLRDRFGPLAVTSGYRSPSVNAAVGGAPDSAHLRGDAADVKPLYAPIANIMHYLSGITLPFDQAIDYGSHLHLSLVSAKGLRRGQLLVKVGDKYLPWKEVPDVEA